MVNFGMSVKDYEYLSETEKLFISKAYEDHTVNFFTHLRNAVMNGVSNAMRKKSKKFIELFKKKQQKVDKEYNQNATAIVEELEARDGKGWVDVIYAANGLKRPKAQK